MFSTRVPAHSQVNALSRALEVLQSRGIAIVDLTESNPTRVGLSFPQDLLAPLSSPAALTYRPQPFGMTEAREAVARDHRRRGAEIDPEHVVLTASTSEAYSWLFKLLCNPGDAVLVPQPSYPLFEHLTALEGIRCYPYYLEYSTRWAIDWASIDAAPGETRALLVVSPNNPTGSMLSLDEVIELSAVCRRRNWALIADEVFADYALDAASTVTDIATRAENVLSFSLGGFSKTVGLPQVKLAWIVAGGPEEECRTALRALEFIADTYLSVATPVQVAAPRLLADAAPVREAIKERTRSNLDRLRRIARASPACDVLRIDGGWSAVVRVPSTRGEEQLVLDLLEQERVIVHPGYYFDFPRETHVVLSLLPSPDSFEPAVERLLRFACR